MAHRQKEIKKCVEAIVRDDLGLEVVEFGIRRGSQHQYVRVLVDGVERDLSFSLTPKRFGRGMIRSDFVRRLRDWGHEVGSDG